MCQFIVLMNLNLIAIPLSGKEKNIRKHERVDWTREKNSRKDAPSCSQSSQGGCSLNQRRNHLGVVINKM
jgi:hypothetical protein